MHKKRRKLEMSEWDKMLFACAMTIYGIFYLLRQLHAVRLLLKDMNKKNVTKAHL